MKGELERLKGKVEELEMYQRIKDKFDELRKFQGNARGLVMALEGLTREGDTAMASIHYD